jgi:hypothetical protein
VICSFVGEVGHGVGEEEEEEEGGGKV